MILTRSLELRTKSLQSLLFFILFLQPVIAFAQPPEFSKAFLSSTIGPGSTTSLVFTITNGDASTVTDLAFTDTLPADVILADPVIAENSCNGTLTAPNGGSSISLTGGWIGASTSCSITVDVTSSTAGTYTNTSGALTSNEGNSGTATADLTVSATRPGFSKSFSPNSVSFGGRSTLTFTIDNTQNGADLTQLAFIDNLPTGMVIADPPNATTTCGTTLLPATLVALAGTNSISLSAFSGWTFPGPVYNYPLTAEATCTVNVDVTANSVGNLENSSSELSTSSGSSGKANASLEVTTDAVLMTKSFTNDPVSPGATVDLTFTIVNTDRGKAATDISFTDDLDATLTGLVATGLLQSDLCGSGSILLGSSMLSLTGGNLASEGSCTFTVTLQVPADAATGSYPNTTSSLTADLGGSPQTSSPASDTLFVAPLPLLTKTFSADTAKSGDTVNIEFTITNTSTDLDLSSIAFTDSLAFAPASLSITPSSNPCGTGSSFINNTSNGNILTLSNGQLAADASCTFTATFELPADAPFGTYTNTTSTITATLGGTTPLIGPAATDTIDITSGSLSLSKSFVDDPVAPGGTVTLEFTLTNPTETHAATDITFTDNLNAALTDLAATGLPQTDICGAGSSLTGSTGDTLLTLDGGSLGAGESCTFSVTLDIPTGTAPGSYTNTTSDVSATVSGQTVTSTAASDTVHIAGISFTKEFLDDPVIAGEQTTLRFTIKNIHPSDDATAIAFTDNLSSVLSGLAVAASLPTTPCGTGSSITGTTSLTFTGGELTTGESCTFDVTLSVPAGSADGSYNNTTSSLTATQGGGGVVIDPATNILAVDSNRLQLVKSFTDDPVAPGNSVTLEFTLTNLDAAQAATGIAFTDDLSATLPDLTFVGVGSDTCGSTVTGETTTTITVADISLAAGASCTIQTTLTVPGGATPGIFTNTTSTVSGTIGGLSVTGDTTSDNLEIINLLGFSKSFDSPSTATGVTTLTFTITNPGSNTATDIAFTDDLNAVINDLMATNLPLFPCGLGSSITGTTFLTFTGGEVAASGECSFAVDVTVPASTIAGTYSNSTSDLTRNHLKFADPATADLTIEPPPTFAKAFTPDSIPINQASNLTFTIDNSAGSLDASSLNFTDILPAGVVVASPANASTTCTGGTLTAVNGSGIISYTGGTVGAGASCTIQADVTSSTPGSYENLTGDLTSSSGNSGTATDTLQASPPPAFSKSFSPDSIVRDQISTLTFTIDNSVSTLEATGLDFTDNLPAGVVVATPANAGTNCTGGTLTAADGSGVVTYTGGSMSAGSTCTVQVDVSSGTAGSHVNTTGDLTSSSGSSGTAGATLTVNPPPGFSKSFSPDTINTGGNSTLTFTINNSVSTQAATSLNFTDNLPAGVVVATPSNAGTNCTDGTLTAAVGSGVITYTGGSVSAGSTCTVQVDVSSGTAGSHVNTTGNLTSSSGSSATAGATLTVNPPPGFSKSFSPDTINTGGNSTLTFTINNSVSTQAATSLNFTDNLPAGVVVATPSNAGTNCTGGTLTAADGSGVITYTGGSVSAGSTCTVQVDVSSGIAGSHVNTTGDLTSSLGSSGTAGATLTVVNLPPGFSKSFSPDAINTGGNSTLTFTINNSVSTQAATGLDFTDNLPAGVVVATPSNAGTNCTGGTLTAADGSGVITYTGGSVSAGSTCTVQVDVSSGIAGSHVNTTGDLTSSLGSSGTAGATLTVMNLPPSFSKSFSPNAINTGGISTLTFTINNSVSTQAATGLDFTDNLPAGVVVATPSNAGTNCTGGTLTAADESGVITYTGGSVGAGSTCTVQVNVSCGIIGSHVNTTGDLTSSLGSSGTAGATLTVNPPPGFSKSFSPDAINTGGNSRLTFTINNNVSTQAATGLDFTDNLPTGVVVATPSNSASTCLAGTLVAVSGTETIDYSNGEIAAGTVCTVSVDITSNQVGTYLSTSDVLDSSAGNSGVAAATLTVRKKDFPWWTFWPGMMKSFQERSQTE